MGDPDSCSIGIDLGGTKIAGVLMRRSGEILARTRKPTPVADGPEVVIEQVTECIRDLLATSKGDVMGVGIGSAGMVNHVSGKVILAVNLGWENIPLLDEVAGRLGPGWEGRIFVDNDTNSTALGEWLYGAGRGTSHMICITIGTGIGSGLILDGRLYHGATYGAGQIGHLVMEPDGPPCRCGKRGCLEALASGTAIRREALSALEHGEDSILADSEREALTTEDVADAALRGDELAKGLFEKAGRYIGAALACYVALNNPELIVIGGGMASLRGLLLEPIRHGLYERVLPINAKATDVVTASLGPDAGAIGAATLAWGNPRDKTLC